MKFWKMQAAGNDFVVFDGIKYDEISDYNDLALKLCDRHFGVGSDGMMFCSPSKNAQIYMNYYNSDGSRGEMCGNGIRCFTKFVYENNIVSGDVIKIETDAGIKTVYLEKDGDEIKSMSVSIGSADFKPSNIPCILGDSETINEEVLVLGKSLKLSACLMGVPHVMIEVSELDEDFVNKFGKALEVHEIFPRKANINFVKVIDKDTVQIKTWERGAGRTLGCGTGSGAVSALLYKLGKINQHVKIINDGGDIDVLVKEDYEIILSGMPSLNFTGEITLLKKA